MNERQYGDSPRFCPHNHRQWSHAVGAMPRRYLHLQVGRLRGLAVVVAGEAVHAENQRKLWPQHTAAKEAGGLDTRLQRPEVARQP